MTIQYYNFTLHILIIYNTTRLPRFKKMGISFFRKRSHIYFYTQRLRTTQSIFVLSNSRCTYSLQMISINVNNKYKSYLRNRQTKIKFLFTLIFRMNSTSKTLIQPNIFIYRSSYSRKAAE